MPDREHPTPEALLADRYLDDLLAAVERGADAAPADTSLDPGLRDAAAALRRSLVRVHPSFRFEERLSARLAELAEDQVRSAAAAAGRADTVAVTSSGRTGPRAVTTGGTVLAWARRTSPAPGATEADPLLEAIIAGHLDPADESALADAALVVAARPSGVPRPLLLGGAITSAAISLAGVAWFAWRASRQGHRPATSPSSHGTRARRIAATAAAAGAAGGLGGQA